MIFLINLLPLSPVREERTREEPKPWQRALQSGREHFCWCCPQYGGLAQNRQRRTRVITDPISVFYCRQANTSAAIRPAQRSSQLLYFGPEASSICKLPRACAYNKNYTVPVKNHTEERLDLYTLCMNLQTEYLSTDRRWLCISILDRHQKSPKDRGFTVHAKRKVI